MKWVEAIVLAVSSTAALIVVLMLIRSMGEPLWTQEASGWAQAIGSVAAIMVTVILFRRQNEALARQAATDRKLDLLQRRQAAHAVCVRAAELIEEFCEAYFGHFDDIIRITEYLDERFSENAFKHMQEVLSAVPHHDLGSYYLTAAVLDLRDSIETCQNLGAVGKSRVDQFEWREETYGQMERAKSQKDSAMEALKTAMLRAKKDAAA